MKSEKGRKSFSSTGLCMTLLVFGLVMFPGCGGGGDGEGGGGGGPTPERCIDQDGDGYGVQSSHHCPREGADCDDGNADVSPGATEICGDGFDNDCSGAEDDRDLDGDGYISDDTACGGDDCDDERDRVHPNTEEICGDGLDNDCSGSEDDRDLDGDGYISDDPACSGNDCDDLNPGIHPSADEAGAGLCNDGVDQDCDGRDCQCTPGSGLCCDESGFYRPSSYKCDNNATTEYGCPWGTACGDEVGIRYGDRYCSGSSSSCNGSLQWGSWAITDNCTAREVCAPNDSSCNESSACCPGLSSSPENPGLLFSGSHCNGSSSENSTWNADHHGFIDGASSYYGEPDGPHENWYTIDQGVFQDKDMTSDSAWDEQNMDRRMAWWHDGHGSTHIIWTQSEGESHYATLAEMALGEYGNEETSCETDGSLRYFFIKTCASLAHGPKCSNGEYCRPDLNSGTGFVDGFAAVRPVIRHGFRIICGFSSYSLRSPDYGTTFWDEYQSRGVADSWLYAAAGVDTSSAAVCYACGAVGGSAISSDLYFNKSAWSSTSCTSGTIHKRWIRGANAPGGKDDESEVKPMPAYLPVFALSVPPLPEEGILGIVPVDREGGWLVKGAKEEIDYPIVRFDTSGGTLLVAPTQPIPTAFTDSLPTVEIVEDFLVENRLGLSPDDLDRPKVLVMEEAAYNPDTGERTEPVKLSERVVSRRLLRHGDEVYPTVGPGSVFAATVDGTGDVTDLRMNRRCVADWLEVRPTIPFEEALEEAYTALPEGRDYGLEEWQWGYHLEGSGVEQAVAKPYYRFVFLFTSQEDRIADKAEVLVNAFTGKHLDRGMNTFEETPLLER